MEGVREASKAFENKKKTAARKELDNYKLGLHQNMAWR